MLILTRVIMILLQTTFPTPARQFPFKESRNLVHFKSKGNRCIRLEAMEKWLLEWEPVCSLNYRCYYLLCIRNHMELINQFKTKTTQINYFLINEKWLKDAHLHFSFILFIFCSRKFVEVKKVTALTIFQWSSSYTTCKTLNLYLNATQHAHGYCV